MTENRLCQVVLAPNDSHTWVQSAIFLASIGAIMLIIGGFFAWHGLWLILPFAGLEFAALSMCLVMVSKSGAQRQVISIDNGQILVENGACRHRLIKRHGPNEAVSFSRSWARLDMLPSRHSWYPSRLVLRASGKKIEIGSFLTEEERARLAGWLSQWLAQDTDLIKT